VRFSCTRIPVTRTLTILLVCVFLWPAIAAAGHFAPPVSTPYSADFIGRASTGGTPVAPGDEIAAFDPQGVLCGLFLVASDGSYGALHVYGDDPSTTGDEGAQDGDIISFRVWDAGAGIERGGSDLVFSTGAALPGSSFIPSPIPPVWHDQQGYILNIDSASHFGTPVTSSVFCQFIGSLNVLGQPVSTGDEVGVFDSSGTLVGMVFIRNTGKYGILTIYGDDSKTIADEGAVSGEALTFAVWDAKTGVERSGVELTLSPGAAAGSFSPSPLPPAWQADGAYVMDIEMDFQYQSVALSPDSIETSGGRSFSVSASYDVSNNDNALSGLGVRFHYDSSRVTFDGFSNVFTGQNLSVYMVPVPAQDVSDFDHNAATDVYVSIEFVSGSFPGVALPVSLADLGFTIKTGALPGLTVIDLSFFSNAAGYESSGTGTRLVISNPAAGISGTISYGGNAPGLYYVGAWPSSADFRSEQPEAMDVSADGTYMIRLVPGDYKLFAWRDTDGGSSADIADIDDQEPHGFYSTSPGSAGQSAEPRVISLASDDSATADFSVYDQPYIIGARVLRENFPASGLPDAFPKSPRLFAGVTAGFTPGLDGISSVTVSGPGISGAANLLDNGVLPDEQEGDGVFSAWIDTGGPPENGDYVISVNTAGFTAQRSLSLSGSLLALFDLTSPPGLINTQSPLFSWNEPQGAATYVLMLGQNGNAAHFYDFTFASDPVDASPFSLDPGSYLLSDGSTYYCLVIATGITGQNRSFSGQRVFSTDLSQPTVAAIDFAPPLPVGAGELNLVVTFSEPMDQTVPVSVLLTDLGGGFSGGFTGPQTWSGTHLFTAGDHGTHTLSITGGSDPAGNIMAPDTNRVVTIDLVPPAITSLTLSPASPVSTGVVTFSILFTEDMNTSVLPEVSFGEPARVLSGAFASARLWKGDTLFSFNDDGDYIIHVSGAEDHAGNAMDPDSGYSFTVDTVAPLAPVIGPVTTPTIEDHEVVSGTKEAGAAILLNNIVVVPAGPETAWQFDTPLGPGQNQLVFSARDAAGNKSAVAVVKITFDNTPPPAVAVLSADGRQDGVSVNLDWTGYDEAGIGDIAYYRLYAQSSDFDNVTGLEIRSTSDAGHFSKPVTGLTTGTTYWFAVVPVDTHGNSISGVKTVSAVPTDAMPPAEAANLVVDCTSGTAVTISWQPPAAADLSAQLVTFGSDAEVPLGPDITQFSKASLLSDTAYPFTIREKDASGNTSQGVVLTIVTLIPNPTGITVLTDNGFADVSWQAPSSSFVANYNIYVSENYFSDVSSMQARLSVAENQASARITGLANETQYYFAVTAVNPSGCQNPAVTTVAATPHVDVEPPVISGVTVNGQILESGMLIDRDAEFSASVTDAKSQVAKVRFSINGNVVYEKNTAPYAFAWDVDAFSDGAYLLTIEAFDIYANRATTEFSLNLQLATPAAPAITSPVQDALFGAPGTSVSGTALPGAMVSVLINDRPSGQAGAAGDGTFSIPVTLVEGENRIQATAENRAGVSSRSAIVSVTMDSGAPSPPERIEAETRSGGIVRLTWQAPSAGEVPAGYNVYLADTLFSDPGAARKVNTTPVAAVTYDKLFVDDSTVYFGVTSVDAAGNQSALGGVIRAFADAIPPSVTGLVLTPGGAYDAGIYGPGVVDIELEVNEQLSSDPFVSIAMAGAAPLAVNLTPVSDTTYTGDFQITEATPTATGTLIFSARDMAGNRGTEVTPANRTIEIDTRGPRVVGISMIPLPPVKNDPANPVTLQAVFTLDEPVRSGTVPAFVYYTIENPGGLTIPDVTPGGSGGDDTLEWNVGLTLSSSDGQAAGDFIRFGFAAEDHLGNAGNAVIADNHFELYQGGLPPFAAPGGLEAVAGPGGNIDISFEEVSGAAFYRLYRKGPADADFFLIEDNLIDFIYSDQPGPDGTYAYAVTSVRRTGPDEAESSMSNPVTVDADNSPPSAPEGLSLLILGDGVRADWSAPLGETPFEYRLYRAESDQALIPDAILVASVAGHSAIDPHPSSSTRYYAVTGVDAAGNESSFSNWAYQNVDLLPTDSLGVVLAPGQSPVVSWTHPGGATITGFDLVLNTPGGEFPLVENRMINVFTDTGFAGNPRPYTVYALDNQQNKSVGRSVTLPALEIDVNPRAVIYRGLVSPLLVTVINKGDTSVIINRLEAQIQGEVFSSEAFSVDPGQSVDVPMAIPGDSGWPDTLDADISAVITPSSGTSVRITQNAQIMVADNLVPLSLTIESMVRGGVGKVSFSLTNTGAELLEILSAGPGGDESDEIRVSLEDTDGNTLAAAGMRQTTGDMIQIQTNGAAIVSIPAGATFESDPITVDIPFSAPDEVRVRLEINKAHFRYGWPDHLVLTGPAGGAWRQALGSATLVDTAYGAMLDSVSPQNAVSGQTVTLSGLASDTITGAPAPGVEVKIGVMLNGFVREFSVYADESGRFSYGFNPLAGESGMYRCWAVHPDVTEKPVQQTFTVSSLHYTPAYFTWNLLRGRADTLNVSITNSGGTPINNLALLYRPGDQEGGQAVPGITVSLPDPVGIIPGDSNAALTFQITASDAAAKNGSIVLSLVSDETPDGIWGTVRVDFTVFDPQPVLAWYPGYYESSLHAGDQDIGTVTLHNQGLTPATGLHLALAPVDPGPELDWIHLNIDPDPADLSSGETLAVPISFQPPAQIPVGEYEYLLRVTGADLSETIHVYVRITPAPGPGGVEAGGNVLFHVVDLYFDGVTNLGLPGVGITLQNGNDPNLIFTQKTMGEGDPDMGPGEAMFAGIPAGNYNYKVVADGHDDYSGSVFVKTDATATEQVYLNKQLVSVEWEVVPTTIEDHYEIKLSATFETNVPDAVVTLEPMTINLPEMEVGEVLTGEFKLTNHGFIRARSLEMNLPEDDPYYHFEVLGVVPEYLEAKQQVILPYRITAISTYASAASDNYGGPTGGGKCGVHYASVCMTYITNPCPGIPALEVRHTVCARGIYYHFCPGTPGRPSPQPPSTGGGGTSGGWGGWGSGGAGGGWGGWSTARPVKGFRCPKPCKPGEPCNSCCKFFFGPGAAQKGCGGGDDGDDEGSPADEINDFISECAGKGPLGSIAKGISSVKDLKAGLNKVRNILNRAKGLTNGTCGQGSPASTDAAGSTINLMSGKYQDHVQDLYVDAGGLGIWAARTFDGAGGWQLENIDERIEPGGRAIYYSGGITAVDSGSAPVYYEESRRIVDERWTIIKEGVTYAASSELPGDTTPPADGLARNYIFKNGAYTIKTEGGYFDDQEGLDLYAFGPHFHFDAFLWQDTHGPWRRYDSTGRLIEYGGSASGRKISLVWENGLLKQIQDPLGNVVLDYRYDGGDRPIEIARLDVDGNELAAVAYTWSDNHIATVTDVLGDDWTFVYDAIGRIIQKTEPGGHKYVMTYDAYDSVVTYRAYQTDGQDEVLVASKDFSYEYDRGRAVYLTTLETGEGVVYEYEFDAKGSVKLKRVNGETALRLTTDLERKTRTIRDASGNATLEKYNDKNDIVSVEFPDNSKMNFKYSSNYARPVEMINRAGTKTRYSYDAKGRVVSTIQAVGLAEERIITMTHADSGRPARIENNGALVRENTYDGEGRLIAVKRPESRDTGFTYDDQGFMTAMTDPMGFVTTYGYDAAGRQAVVRRPVDDTTSLVTQIFYDAYGNRTAEILADGTRLDLTYNLLGGLTAISRADTGDTIRSMAYNLDGHLVSETDAAGNVWTYEYDSLGRRSAFVDPVGNRTEFSYGPPGDTCDSCLSSGGATVITWPNATLIKKGYDWDGRMISEMFDTHAGTITRTYAYDKSGGLASITDGNGRQTLFKNDGLGRLVEVINGAGESVKFERNDQNRITRMVDGEGRAIQYAYDGARRMTGITDPAGNTTTLAWDANDRPVLLTDPGANTIVNTYDRAGRLVTSVAGSSSRGAQRTVSYTYTGTGQVATATDGLADYSFSYDYLHHETGQDVTLSVPGAAVVTESAAYEYYANGWLKSVTGPDNEKVTYEYDAAGALVRIVLPGTHGQIDITNQFGKPVQADYPGSVTDNFAYDPLLLMSGFTVKKDGTSVIDRSYGYDSEGNLTSYEDVLAGNSRSYAYDAAYRLTGFDAVGGGRIDLTYDKSGNRISDSRVAGNWIYDDANRLQQAGADTFSHDACGNLVQSVRGGNTTVFAHDAENHLDRAIVNGNVAGAYAYDMRGRRIYKEAGADKTIYVYGKQGLLAEFDGGTGALKVSYGYLPDSTFSAQPLYMRTWPGGAFYFFHLDYLGRPVLMTDESGNTVWQADYDPFGAIHISVEIVSNNLRLPGQYADAETGLYYNYTRYYDPALGRYIESDTNGPPGAMPGPYVYAANNPLTHVDPEGMVDVAGSSTQDLKSVLSDHLPTAKDANVGGHMKKFLCKSLKKGGLKNLTRNLKKMGKGILKGGWKSLKSKLIPGFYGGAGIDSWDDPINPCAHVEVGGNAYIFAVSYKAEFRPAAYAMLLRCNSSGGFK